MTHGGWTPKTLLTLTGLGVLPEAENHPVWLTDGNNRMHWSRDCCTTVFQAPRPTTVAVAGEHTSCDECWVDAADLTARLPSWDWATGVLIEDHLAWLTSTQPTDAWSRFPKLTSARAGLALLADAGGPGAEIAARLVVVLDREIADGDALGLRRRRLWKHTTWGTMSLARENDGAVPGQPFSALRISAEDQQLAEAFHDWRQQSRRHQVTKCPIAFADLDALVERLTRVKVWVLTDRADLRYGRNWTVGADQYATVGDQVLARVPRVLLHPFRLDRDMVWLGVDAGYTATEVADVASLGLIDGDLAAAVTALRATAA